MAQTEDKIDGAEDRSVTLGNTEDVTRDNTSGPHIAHQRAYPDWKEKKGCRKIHLLSLNSQGLEGAWRLLHLIVEHKINKADVIMIQEVGANLQQWKTMYRFMLRHGFKGFFTAGIQNTKKKHWNRHRGVATFVRSGIPTKWHHEVSTDAGQAHAVDIQGVLVINNYTVNGESIPEHISSINDMFLEIGWTGEWIAGGDWNETFSGSWAASLCLMHGGWQNDVSKVSSARWEGKRCIDYYMGTAEMSPLSTCLERISDHMIVRTSYSVDCAVPSEECRFKRYPTFTKPAWLSNMQWQKLMEEACIDGIQTNWQEACQMVEKACPEQDSYDEQTMVDYVWTLTCAQLTWIFKTSCCAALHCIPLGFEDMTELKRIQKLANYNNIKGVEVVVMDKQVCSKRQTENETIRKRWKDLGRINALRRQVKKNTFNNEGRRYAEKFFKKDIESISLEEVLGLESKMKDEVERMQSQHRRQQLSNWAKRMKLINHKAEWLNKKGSCRSPTVDDGSGKHSNKTQDAKTLWQYWDQFWKGQQWTVEELEQKRHELTEILRPLITGANRSFGRPKLSLFKTRIKSVKGCAGADGWSKDEILAISRCDIASKLVWDSMEVWERFGLSPTAVANCKMVMIPKKDNRLLKADGFRPIAVQSAWWRAWSSTWLRSKWISSWVSLTFPKNVSGGIPGSFGPETMATVVDYKLGELKHGVTLDLKHAFDSVHLQLLEDVFLQILPAANHGWIKLVFGHWKKMKRWIVLDSHVCKEALCPDSGLPQGDPLSPLVLVVMMHALQLLVEQRCEFRLWHFIYMDDRTIVAETKHAIDQAQEIWSQVADEYHLIENGAKAQKVDISKKSQSFEVLGALLGKPLASDVVNSKAIDRLCKAAERYRKIRFLPESMPNRMVDAKIFGGGIISYGWISHQPGAKRIKTHMTELWRGLGKTQFSAVNMRKTVAGAHLHLCVSVLLRQIRLLQKRNIALEDMYSVDILSTQMTSLEQMVTEGLVELDWQKDERFGRWTHVLSPRGFDMAEVLDDKKWSRICHDIRESYRQIAFEEHRISTRHEIAGQDVGPYDPQRRRLAVKWAKKDATANMLILGAIQSPLLRSMTSSQEQSVCSKCKMENPRWDHLWECFIGVVPADTLLRRYCWPRKKDDFALCTEFLECIRDHRC